MRPTPKGIARSRLVGTRFQVLFTPLAGVLFAFPSRYWFAIGRRVVFSLGRWSSQIPTGFHEPRGTRVPSSSPHTFRLPGCHRLWPAFPGRSARWEIGNSPGFTPGRPHDPKGPKSLGLGYAPFRSPLLGGSLLISFPPGTEMFQFPGFASVSLCIQPTDFQV